LRCWRRLWFRFSFGFVFCFGFDFSFGFAVGVVVFLVPAVVSILASVSVSIFVLMLVSVLVSVLVSALVIPYTMYIIPHNIFLDKAQRASVRLLRTYGPNLPQCFIVLVAHRWTWPEALVGIHTEENHIANDYVGLSTVGYVLDAFL
jgi:hypothetical protein